MTHKTHWKNGEYHYITELVRTRGNSNVPQTAVLAYLDLQATSAARDGEPDIAKLIHRAYITLIINKLSPEAFDKAYNLLVAP